MKIQILGTRGEIASSSPIRSKHSGVLIDETILFDLGEPEFLNYNPEYIFITHLHPDHAFFVRNKVDKLPEKIIYLPEKCNLAVNANVLTKAMQFKNYIITPIPTIHSFRVRSQSYLLETENKRVLYTGDLISIATKYHKLLSKLDLVITEASFIRRNGLIKTDEKSGKIHGHTGIPNLIDFFSRFTNQIVFVHFGSWFFKNEQESKDKILKLASKKQVEACVAYDGMTLLV
jgi:ribonuclease BN (tRNA processing enzyme)